MISRASKERRERDKVKGKAKKRIAYKYDVVFLLCEPLRTLRLCGEK
jgi:hypothetical protein